MTRRWWGVLGMLALGGVLHAYLPAGSVDAQQPPAAVPQVVAGECTSLVSVEGKDNYDAYCAVCHGRNGRGQGPAAPAMKLPVPDLTLLAARNGGKFDFLAVRDAIESGGTMKTVHGTVDMPLWGPLFRTTDSHWTKAHLRLQNLVRYLETIQRTS